MFSWRSSGGSEPLDGLGNMSKTDILRGIITEKLSTAAREILAVVERTVADYEEEASGFRRKIQRQRRQLEVLQPHVKLNRVSLEEEEEQLTQQTGEEDGRSPIHDDDDDDDDDEGQQLAQTIISRQKRAKLKDKTTPDVVGVWSPCPPISDIDDDDDDEEEWEQQMEEPMILSVQKREYMKDPDFYLPSRSVSRVTPSVKRGPGRPRTREPDNHLDIRVRFLDDSETMVLSNLVFRNTPMQDLRCPPGLQEADFLNLLKSALPQLEGKRFGIFRSDRSRRLQRFRVKTLTPEEIYRSFQPNRMQKVALYFKLLTQEEQEEEDPQMLPSDIESPSAGPEGTESSETGLCLSIPVHHEDCSGENAPASQLQEAGDSAKDTVLSGSDKDEAEGLDDDGDWQPCPEKKLTVKKKRRRAEAQTAERVKMSCKVCGVWYRIIGGLKRHAWTHVDEPQGVCGICGDDFKSVDELKGHLQDQHECYVCSYCGKCFGSINSLNTHMAVHTGNGLFSCNVCSKTFTTMPRLNIHRTIHLKVKPYKCDICEKSFGLELQLNHHRKMHMSRDEHRCNVCGKTFGNRRSLAFHKLIHTGERPHACQVCGKTFKLPHQLKSHMNTHTVRERPFLCHICCKSFYSNQALMSHMLTHSGDKAFLCTICGKTFLKNGNLQLHMRVHTREKPYKCSICGRLFRFKGILKHHIRSHLGIKDYICGVCGKACSRPEHLKVHMRTHNGERPYQCTICDKAFTQSHCLKTHMKSHRTEEKPALDPSLDPSLDPALDSALVTSLNSALDPGLDPALVPSLNSAFDPALDPSTQ